MAEVLLGGLPVEALGRDKPTAETGGVMSWLKDVAVTVLIVGALLWASIVAVA